MGSVDGGAGLKVAEVGEVGASLLLLHLLPPLYSSSTGHVPVPRLLGLATFAPEKGRRPKPGSERGFRLSRCEADHSPVQCRSRLFVICKESHLKKSTGHPPLYNAAVRDSTEVVRSLLARKYRQDLDDTGGGLSFLTMQRNI